MKHTHSLFLSSSMNVESVVLYVVGWMDGWLAGGCQNQHPGPGYIIHTRGCHHPRNIYHINRFSVLKIITTAQTPPHPTIHNIPYNVICSFAKYYNTVL